MLEPPYLTVVVDDEPDLVEIISGYIKHKYADLVTIKTFTNPQEAFGFVSNNEVAIVFSDLIMPGLHGLDFTRNILKLERGIQCVVISGDTSYSSIFECFLNGSSAFVCKPISMEKIIEAMDKCIACLKYWHKTINQATTV